MEIRKLVAGLEMRSVLLAYIVRKGNVDQCAKDCAMTREEYISTYNNYVKVWNSMPKKDRIL